MYVVYMRRLQRQHPGLPRREPVLAEAVVVRALTPTVPPAQPGGLSTRRIHVCIYIYIYIYIYTHIIYIYIYIYTYAYLFFIIVIIVIIICQLTTPRGPH